MKKVFKIIKFIILLGILFLLGFYFLVKNYWKNIIDESELNEFVSVIKSTKNLPENFYNLYEIENNNALSYNLNLQIVNAIINSDFIKPPSAQISSMFIFSSNIFLDSYKMGEISLAWEIEKRTSQRECLNWLTEKYNFLNDAIGINEASKIYFKKDFKKLNEKELATLIIMLENPAYYNPFKRQKRIDKRIDKLLEKSKVK